MNSWGNVQPSVCIDAVLPGQSISDALQVVSDCGISAFEFWCWWEKDIDEIIEASDRFEMSVAAVCTKFISLVQPELRSQYLDGLAESLDAAKRLNCTTLISQVGDLIPLQPRASQQRSLVDGLLAAAPMLEASGVTLVIEPLNEKVDHPGYYLIHSHEAFEIIEQVGSPNVRVVYDIYHQQISEGNLIHNIVTNVDKIGHFHAAGNPGRNEIDAGEINYPEVIRSIKETGYQGYIGLEYWPVKEPICGLRKAASFF